MAINTLGFPMPQAFSGGADFSQLANLGNVYQQQQDRTTRLQALGQLGTDPTQNAMILIKSGDPQMAQHGIELMNTIQQQNRLNAQEAERQREFQANYQLAQSKEAREQQKFEADDPDARLAKWTAAHPGQDPNSPAAQAYAYKQPQLLKSTLPPMIQKRYLDNQAAIAPASDIMDNLDEMKKLSTEAVGGGLLGKWEMKAGESLPESLQPKAVQNMQNMRTLATQNILQQVKTLFPNRVLQSEFQTLKMLENPESYSDKQRQFAYDHLKKLIQTRIDEMQTENDQIDKGQIPGTMQPNIAKGGGGSAQTTEQTITPPGTTLTSGEGTPQLRPIPDRLSNRAKAAIAGGKDRKAVRQAIIDGGYDPGDIGQ
jgi:hypothetical protein